MPSIENLTEETRVELEAATDQTLKDIAEGNWDFELLQPWIMLQSWIITYTPLTRL